MCVRAWGGGHIRKHASGVGAYEKHRYVVSASFIVCMYTVSAVVR